MAVRNRPFTAPKRPTQKQLNAQVAEWNATHPIGTMVSFENIRGAGETHRGKSKTEASVLNGSSAVIWIEGKSGCVMLSHCKAILGVADDAA